MTSAETKFKEVRVRIAPSPTGLLHLGTARAALFNYLFAKHEGGKFILRIEDTDLERSKKEYEKDIIEALQWLGLLWDEGPIRQSERTENYTKYLKKLLDENKAYYCFCSEEELEGVRQDQMSRGEPAVYNGKCRGLSREEVEKRLAKGEPAIIRFRTPAQKVVFHDLIRDKVEFDSTLIGDFSIAKTLETPLYNFAVVIDDYDMQISHVIRGEDHIPNTPRQILLLEALGFPKPQYAHLPMILGPDKSKLSKRHGATSVNYYRQDGYLAEAIINFMAFLGWNPGTEKEIYSLAALAKEFTLDKVQKAGAVFNIKRLDYLNGFYIRQKSVEKLTELCLPYLPQAPKDYLQKVVALHQERLKKLSEITEFSDFFFKDKLVYDKELLRWKGNDNKETFASLDRVEKILSEITEEKWQKENLEKILMAEAEAAGDRGLILWPLRAALTGKKASAGPIDIAAVLGKEKTLMRLKEAKELIK